MDMTEPSVETRDEGGSVSSHADSMHDIVDPVEAV